MDLGLNGKRAIVLGGSRGIGWYTAELLNAEGCRVALCARDIAGVNRAVADLETSGAGDAFGRSVDLRHDDSRRTRLPLRGTAGSRRSLWLRLQPAGDQRR